MQDFNTQIKSFKHLIESVVNIDTEIVSTTVKNSDVINAKSRLGVPSMYLQGNGNYIKAFGVKDGVELESSLTQINSYHLMDKYDKFPYALWLKVIIVYQYFIGNSLLSRVKGGSLHGISEFTIIEELLYSKYMVRFMSNYKLFTHPGMAKKTTEFNRRFLLSVKNTVDSLLKNSYDDTLNNIHVIRGTNSGSYDTLMDSMWKTISVNSLSNVLRRINHANDEIIFSLTGKNTFQIELDKMLLPLLDEFSDIFAIDGEVAYVYMSYTNDKESISKESKSQSSSGVMVNTLNNLWSGASIISESVGLSSGGRSESETVDDGRETVNYSLLSVVENVKHKMENPDAHPTFLKNVLDLEMEYIDLKIFDNLAIGTDQRTNLMLSYLGGFVNLKKGGQSQSSRVSKDITKISSKNCFAFLSALISGLKTSSYTVFKEDGANFVFIPFISPLTEFIFTNKSDKKINNGDFKVMLDTFINSADIVGEDGFIGDNNHHMSKIVPVMFEMFSDINVTSVSLACFGLIIKTDSFNCVNYEKTNVTLNSVKNIFECNQDISRRISSKRVSIDNKHLIARTLKSSSNSLPGIERVSTVKDEWKSIDNDSSYKTLVDASRIWIVSKIVPQEMRIVHRSSHDDAGILDFLLKEGLNFSKINTFGGDQTTLIDKIVSSNNNSFSKSDIASSYVVDFKDVPTIAELLSN